MSGVSGSPVLRFAFWPVRPDIVLDNVRRFSARTGIAVDAEAIPGISYSDVLENRLRGETAPDVFYAQRGDAARWSALDLIEPLDGLPEIMALVKRMMPAIQDSSYDRQGRLVGLTYYNAGPFALFRNEALLARAGFGGTADPASYPSSWDEITRQARELKRGRISAAPLLPRWYDAPTGLLWSLIAHAWAEGERFTDDDGAATFGAGTPIADVLALWRVWWDEELAPRTSIVARDDSANTDGWCRGLHAWTFSIDYQAAVFAQKESQVVTHMHPRIPGRTGDAAIPGHALLCLARGRQGQQRTAALALLRYLGGDGPDEDFFVHRRWIRELNLPVPFPHLIDDDARAAIRKTLYPPLAEVSLDWLLQGREGAVVPPLVRMPWFLPWSEQARGLIAYGMLEGGASVTRTVRDLRTAWDALHAAAMR